MRERRSSNGVLIEGNIRLLYQLLNIAARFAALRILLANCGVSELYVTSCAH